MNPVRRPASKFGRTARPRRLRWVILCLTLGCATLTPAAAVAVGHESPGTDAATAAEPAAGHFAPVSALTETTVTPMATSSVITAGSCKYQQAVDNVHFSSTGWAASSHGWWLKYSGTCPSKANVDVYLQAVYCDGFSCYWKTVDTDSLDVYAGGGSGKRATARENCSASTTVGWRSYVDVDLIGVGDPSGYTYSTPRDMACYPSS